MKKYINRWTIGALILIPFSILFAFLEPIDEATSQVVPMTFGIWIAWTVIVAVNIFLPISAWTFLERIVFPKSKNIFHRIKNKLFPSQKQLHIDTSPDTLYRRAVLVVLDLRSASTSLLQRRLNIGYANAARLIDKMEEEGIVGPFLGATPREVLVTKEQYLQRDLRNKDHEERFEAVSLQNALSRDKIDIVDYMDGHDFEELCARVFRKMGFHKVEVTKGSGDQGVDVLAERDDVRYAIQCKRYSSNLGNTPVQEIVAGKVIYDCQVGMVITNQYFTQGAKELAKANGVLLRDRDWLKQVLDEHDLNPIA